jgi:hypothetical protein
MKKCTLEWRVDFFLRYLSIVIYYILLLDFGKNENFIDFVLNIYAVWLTITKIQSKIKTNLQKIFVFAGLLFLNIIQKNWLGFFLNQ